MDDLSKMLSNILSDEQSMNKISKLAESLGLFENSENDTKPNSKHDLSTLASLLSSSNDEDSSGSDGFDISPDMLLKIGKALSSLKTDDKEVALLRALRPFISAERQHRVEGAIKLLKLLSLLPILKESGILGGIF